MVMTTIAMRKLSVGRVRITAPEIFSLEAMNSTFFCK